MPGPRSAAGIELQKVSMGGVIGGAGDPVIIGFTSRYPDGGHNVWSSVIEGADRGLVAKSDAETGELIDTYTLPEDEGGGVSQASTAGVYNLIDARNHFINPRQQRIDIYGDATPGDRRSPIELLARLEFPERALCRPSDGVIGIEMLPSGRLAFATKLGIVGTVPSRVASLVPSRMELLSLNGDDCADSSIPDEDLEQINNDLGADDRSRLYAVSNRAQYAFATDGGIETVWRTPYTTGEGGGGARLDSGSGSTPTLMGTQRTDDRFVVITDGAKLMNLVLFWRERIPRDWEGLPGRPRRIACEVPVDFGDEGVAESNSEQSVLVRGHAAVVVNNKLAIDDAVGLLPQLPDNVGPLIALTGQDPRIAPYGIERIDWDPRSSECVVRWVNRAVSIPNGVPTMSAGSGLIYGVAQDEGRFGLAGIDFDTGAQRFFRPSGGSFTDNSFFAATTVGPDGDVFTGTIGGLQIFRGPGSSRGLIACETRWIATREVDTIRGSGWGDLAAGRRGRDRLLGGGGIDCLSGGGGRDRIAGGTGVDRMDGGPGRDRIAGGASNDRIAAADGLRDVIDCGPGEDRARVDERDRLTRCESVRRTPPS